MIAIRHYGVKASIQAAARVGNASLGRSVIVRPLRETTAVPPTLALKMHDERAIYRSYIGANVSAVSGMRNWRFHCMNPNHIPGHQLSLPQQLMGTSTHGRPPNTRMHTVRRIAVPRRLNWKRVQMYDGAIDTKGPT